MQRIRVTINDEEQRRMVTELQAAVMSDKCPYLVACYGAMFREGEARRQLSVQSHAQATYGSAWR